MDVKFKINMMMLKSKLKSEISNDYYRLTNLNSDIKKLMDKGVNLYDSRTIDFIHRVNKIGKNNYFNYLDEKEKDNIPYKEVKNLSECIDVLEYLISIVRQKKYEI